MRCLLFVFSILAVLIISGCKKSDNSLVGPEQTQSIKSDYVYFFSNSSFSEIVFKKSTDDKLHCTMQDFNIDSYAVDGDVVTVKLVDKINGSARTVEFKRTLIKYSELVPADSSHYFDGLYYIPGLKTLCSYSQSRQKMHLYNTDTGKDTTISATVSNDPYGGPYPVIKASNEWVVTANFITPGMFLTGVLNLLTSDQNGSYRLYVYEVLGRYYNII